MLGAGPTGCEFADFFSRCGSRVTLVSARDQILPNDDPDLAEVLEEVFLRRGMDVIKNGRAAAIDDEDPERGAADAGGRPRDRVLARAALHRHAPQHAGLGLEAAGVEFGERGTLPIDEFCRTNVGHVYACGDVTGQIMLANTAAMHGRTAAMHALGLAVDPISYTGVAWCVFTRPEIAKAGISERQARIDGTPVSVTKHLIRANPRAVMEGETDGLIKLLSDPDDGTVLGGAMVGFRASEVITTVALAVHAKLGVQALAETAAVNPSMSESLQRTRREGGRRHARRLAGDADVVSGIGAWHHERHTSMRRPGLGDLDRAAVLRRRARSSTRPRSRSRRGMWVKQQPPGAGAGGLAAGLGARPCDRARWSRWRRRPAPPRRRTGRRRGRSAPAARSARCRPSTRSTPRGPAILIE